MSWQPTATIATLQQRANIIATIRQFFSERGVLEVETPLLSQATITDPHLSSFSTQYLQPGAQRSSTLYLQTSPEFSMKRLLAAGSGPIYQICKAFRNEESGQQHNPEFTMLEWYRPGFDYHALMDEMDALLQLVLNVDKAERLSYSDAFQHYLKLDPIAATEKSLQNVVAEKMECTIEWDKDTCLDYLMTHEIEQHLGKAKPTFIYDYPASQAALAKVRGDIAERFEVYVNGVELANGFHELTDSHEQRQRFDSEKLERKQQGLSDVPIDENLLAALEYGLPDCAGVALGIDRLVMLALNLASINDVVSFPVSMA